MLQKQFESINNAHMLMDTAMREAAKIAINKKSVKSQVSNKEDIITLPRNLIQHD